jgi:hypothetical protein
LATVQSGNAMTLHKLLQGRPPAVANAIFDPVKQFSLLHATGLQGDVDKTQVLLRAGAPTVHLSCRYATASAGISRHRMLR